LYWIAVDPAAQGRGVGRALLERVEAEVRARGGRLLLIETSDLPAYAAARRLYQAGGYRREATVHDFYGPGDSLVIYSKSLTPWKLAEAVTGEAQTGHGYAVLRAAEPSQIMPSLTGVC
jgi:predicted N-acetyltransferase YhbS